MAETLLSPGVLARENDQSFLTQQPVQAGAALIGPTVLGEVNIPTLVTSYSDFTNRFGSAFLSGGQLFSYLTNISAFNYFQNGGTTLLVTRVASGSWTSANSTPIYNENETGNLVETLNALSSSITTAPSASVGTYLAVTQSATSGTGTGAKFNIVLSPSSSNVASIIVSGSGTGYTTGDTITISSASLGATGVGTNMVITLNAGDIVNQNAFVLKTISEGNIMNNSGSEDNYGALASGSAYNIRWQIVSRDVTNGIFSLLIRQGDDTTDETNVLETWTNLSLDPTQPNYISAVLGDTYKKVTTVGGDTYIEVVGNYPNQSRYVYVSQVNALTPAYFDNAGIAKNQYTGSIPLDASGSFTSGTGKTVYGPGAKFYNQISGSTNIQGINAADYNTAISLLANQDEYIFNNISAPGLTAADNTSQITNLISLCQNRGDAIAIIDTVPYGAETATVIQKAG